MRVPIEWLREHVDIEGISQEEFLDEMILSGSNLESAFNPTEGVSGVVIGKITKIEKHPDADKLQICTIDVGSEVLQIVTAATNVAEGKIVPVSTVGAVLAGGLKIKKGKLRGVESNGMLCSFEELGFDKSVIPHEFENGILLLDPEFEAHIGEDAIEALGMKPDTIDFEITPNRPDCLSIVGMAREASATFNRPLKDAAKEKDFSEKFKVTGENGSGANGAGITVKLDSAGCSRYIAMSIKNIKIRKSPFWMGLRLMNAGMSPINNIVDITNYVMLELGNPIHAFDRAKITGKIGVRDAKEGEVVVTLDGVERKLAAGDMLIVDDSKPIGIAGVMGLSNSGISDDTTEAVIEIASFDKSRIRATSKRLNLRSEASSRFERGVSVATTEQTARRIAELVEELDAGEIVYEVVDARGERYNELTEPVRVPYDAKRVQAAIGVEFDVPKELSRLCIETEEAAGGSVAVIPHYRLDLHIEADIVEEAARMYGYNNLPVTFYRHNMVGQIKPIDQLKMQLQDLLAGMGFDEIKTYSFVSPGREDEIVGERNRVRLINPLGEEYSVMRTTLLPNMLDVLSRNDRHKNQDLMFFEVGRVYDNDHQTKEGLPSERDDLIAAIYEKGRDFYDIKGVAESLLQALGIRDAQLERDDAAYLHPGRAARYVKDGDTVFRYGELHPEIAEKEGLKGTLVLEASVPTLLKHSDEEVIYHAVSMFPAAERDAAFVVDEAVTSGEIEEIIRRAGKNLLESLKLFDVYRGEKLGAGKKSMAYAMRFRGDHTLTEEEVEKVFNKAIRSVEHGVGAVLRDK